MIRTVFVSDGQRRHRSMLKSQIIINRFLYRFSKISSEIQKVGISGCIKKRSFTGTFF
jgi:hypothetical protein